MKNKDGGGRGGGGGLNNFSLTSERGGLLERGHLIEYLWYFIRDSDMN